MWTTAPADWPAYWLHVTATRRCWVRGAITWLRQALCALRGHSLLMHFEAERVCLECSWCGHQTPGWDLGEFPHPRRTAA